MIRGAAKNHKDVVVVGSKADYGYLESLLDEQKGETTLEQRRKLAARAFEVCAHYDVAIAKYFMIGVEPGLFPGIRSFSKVSALWREPSPGGAVLWKNGRAF